MQNRKSGNITDSYRQCFSFERILLSFSIFFKPFTVSVPLFSCLSYCLFHRLLQIPETLVSMVGTFDILRQFLVQLVKFCTDLSVLMCWQLQFYLLPIPFFYDFSFCIHDDADANIQYLRRYTLYYTLSFIPNVVFFYILRCFHFFRNDVILGYFTLFYINSLFSRTYIAYVNRLFSMNTG